MPYAHHDWANSDLPPGVRAWLAEVELGNRVMRSGFYYGQSNVAIANTAVVLNQLTVSPLIVNNQMTIVEANILVGTLGAGSVVRAGIYGDDGQCWPASLISEFGSFDCSATGLKTMTGLSVLLRPGVYWLGGVCQGAVCNISVVGDAGDSTLVMPKSQSPGNTPRSVFRNGVTATLPDPFGVAPVPTGISPLCPLIHVKAA